MAGGGKTYTMDGDSAENAEFRGVIPRSVDLIFHEVGKAWKSNMLGQKI